MTDAPTVGHNIAAERLAQIVQRYERLEDEKKALADDQKDILAEAHSAGFDKKALRTVLKLRKMESAEREEQELLVDTYMRALGA